MSMLAEQIHAERALAGTPRVTTVSPGYVEAVSLALRHARARLRLPAALPIVWHAAPLGNEGETWHFPDGRAEVHLNAGLDSSPRRIGWVMLHELKHVHDVIGRVDLRPGQSVRFMPVKTARGPRAVAVEILEEGS